MHTVSQSNLTEEGGEVKKAEVPLRVDGGGSRIHHVAVERDSGEAWRWFGSGGGTGGSSGAEAKARRRGGHSRGFGGEGALEA